MPTSPQGIAEKAQSRCGGLSWSAEASLAEEPGARKPHAGICARGGG